MFPYKWKEDFHKIKIMHYVQLYSQIKTDLVLFPLYPSSVKVIGKNRACFLLAHLTSHMQLTLEPSWFIGAVAQSWYLILSFHSFPHSLAQKDSHVMCQGPNYSLEVISTLFSILRVSSEKSFPFSSILGPHLTTCHIYLQSFAPVFSKSCFERCAPVSRNKLITCMCLYERNRKQRELSWHGWFFPP